jgi:hypothetical protein
LNVDKITIGDYSLAAPAGEYVELAADALNACALDREGRIVCWGLDGVGLYPPPVGDGSRELEMGARHACVKRSDRSLLCWGEGMEENPPPTGPFNKYALGLHFGCGERDEGDIECWWCAGADHTCTWGDPAPFEPWPK